MKNKLCKMLEMKIPHVDRAKKNGDFIFFSLCKTDINLH